tara:strand:+ start:107 stop:382 length:276 start_codon:yes stop_codon:yes gene_type:complete
MKDFVSPSVIASGVTTKYNLVANIKHCGDDLKSGCFVVDIRHPGTDQWYEMQDLEVRETIPQLIALSESYIQIWERADLSLKSVKGVTEKK